MITRLHNEYRAQASYAIDRANSAPNENLKADWLRLARRWLSMIPPRIESDEEAFRKAVRHNGTGKRIPKLLTELCR
jgi:hypothetical protein